MDVRLRGSQGKTPTPAPAPPKTGGARVLTPEQIEGILGARQQRELRIARRFVECRGLSDEQLEDLYQETVLALLRRPYQDEKHLCDALRRGIKQRALNLYRNQRRRETILAESAPALHAIETARSAEATPEQVALARQDRLLITEFLAELTSGELEVFWLATEGMGYNRIAKTLGVRVNEARNTLASCERKRERFQLLHDSGRLCGYRSTTITGLLNGRATSHELAQLAIAHVAGCAQCRCEHKTNARQLRRAFEEQAAALLPPTITTHLAGLTHTSLKARTLAGRIRPEWVSFAGDGARERAAALLTGGGASAKLAAGIITTAVIAGSTITATHALKHSRPRAHTHALTRPAAARPRATQTVELVQRPSTPLTGLAAHRATHARAPAPAKPPGRVVTIPGPARRHSTGTTREPGGFAYLGVPSTNTQAATSTPQPTARTSPDRKSVHPMSTPRENSFVDLSPSRSITTKPPTRKEPGNDRKKANGRDQG